MTSPQHLQKLLGGRSKHFRTHQPLQITLPYKQFSSIAISYYCQDQACFQIYAPLPSETSSGFKDSVLLQEKVTGQTEMLRRSDSAYDHQANSAYLRTEISM